MEKIQKIIIRKMGMLLKPAANYSNFGVAGDDSPHDLKLLICIILLLNHNTGPTPLYIIRHVIRKHIKNVHDG